MHKYAKQSIILFIIISMVSVPFVSSAGDTVDIIEEEPSAGAMFADLILIRPIGIIAAILGPCVFLVTLPFSLLGRNVKTAGKKLVVEPFKQAFFRPLGELP